MNARKVSASNPIEAPDEEGRSEGGAYLLRRRAAAGDVDTIEAVEQSRKVLPRDTGAGVLHRDPNGARLLQNEHDDLGTARGNAVVSGGVAPSSRDRCLRSTRKT